MEIEYSSNNSGGSWWLNDKDWKALEDAGWKVEWLKDDPYYKNRCKDGRWLGCLAKKATREGLTPREAIKEFERVTGQDASDEGCNCCGAPHTFSWTDDQGEYHWRSGQDILNILYDRVPGSLREACS